jgi:Zn-dependent oligopeptidase
MYLKSKLRFDRASTGYTNRADFVLEERMAESPKGQNVLKDLLEKSKTSCIKRICRINHRQKLDGLEQLENGMKHYSEKLNKICSIR